MEKVLRLYKNINGEEVAFPSPSNQIITSDFTYSAQRMGGAPTISCTIMWSECLDNMWEGVYCEFNGEKYHIAKTPSSSKDNTDARYKHNVQFVSDRIKLDSVLFYNKVEENKNPLNTSTEFSFWGDIHSFADRLNESLKASNLEYHVEASGVTSEEKLFKAENMFVSSALQEINKTYGLMYYFVGTEIHIGEQQSLISGIDLQYGFDKQLLSINKNNKNNKVVTRITGHGSDENIPYYYPNPTEKGAIDVMPNGGNSKLSKDAFSIVNSHKFASSADIDSPITFQQTFNSTIASVSAQYTKKDGYHTSVGNAFYPKEYKETPKSEKDVVINGSWVHYVEYRLSYVLSFVFNFTEVGHSLVTFSIPDKAKLLGGLKIENLKIIQTNGVGNVEEDKLEQKELNGEFQQSKDKDAELTVSFGEISEPQVITLQLFFDVVAETNTGNADLEDIKNYRLYCYVEQEENDKFVWNGSRKSSSNIEDFGIRLLEPFFSAFQSNKAAYVGEGFLLSQTEYIQPSKYLMPSVYRAKKGTERFYNAQNGVYTDEDGNDIVFINEYDANKPSEHVENFEDIKPTIKGVKNSFNEPIDCFSAFAYDLNDNDETDEDGKYIHPYFFGKLRALDFNLFDQAIDSGEMTISMTTGHCASCNFVIGVDDQQQKNLVQVDENGNLLRDENGNVICGRKVFVDGEWVGQSATPQDRQNDTTLNEVWVALKKDTNTFGYIYPNKNVKPSEGDNFVILHIDLPQTYITNAEAKLDAALIEFMRKNNAEEFDYSVKFSRIFWEENPTALASFNENSRVNVLYNSESAQMFVSSFTYKCSSNEALPEISVSLSKELNIGTNTIQSVVNELKDFEGTVSILEQQSRAKAAPAIRKDIDDDAYGAVTFHQKPTFKEGIQSDKAIKVGVGASEGFADGTGTYIDERKIQVRDLEVRGSLKVTDLVASQIHSLDGEYIFTDTMKIDRVLPTGKNENGRQTCKLYFEKEYRNDFLKFYVGDLLLSVVANIDDSESSVKVDDAGNAMREISMDSFMRVTHTSDSMSDVLWADVEILDSTSIPSDGAYVARKGNVVGDEDGLKRATSWSISVNDGRIVYYINQTNETREGNLKDNNYGLVIGRLPDITPIQNVGAVGEIGIYAKYLLAQHITQVRWVGDTRYVTIDRGDWREDEAKKQTPEEPYYFYKEEPKTEGANQVTYITRTKVEHNQCTWICQQNVVEIKENGEFVIGDYNTQEPSIGSGWAILSGGGTVTEITILYTTTSSPEQPTDYDTDGMAIGGDEVKWEYDQKDCEYNALFPYMWKKTTTKTMSNPRGDTTIELIGVYGETGLDAHIEVQGGNNIIVPCDSSLHVKEDCSFSRKAVFYIDNTALDVQYEDITEGQVSIGHSFSKGIFTFTIAKGTKLGNEQKLSFRFRATDTSNGKETEYTRIVTFTFTPNTSEQAYSINVSPSTLYVPVKDGVISADGSASATVRVLSGSTFTDVKVSSIDIKYYGSTTGYIDASAIDGDNEVSIVFNKDTVLNNESDYALLEITMDNEMKTSIPVLQNISGSNAVGEDAYSVSITPNTVFVTTNSDGQIIYTENQSLKYPFKAEMYKGSGNALPSGVTISASSASHIFEDITPRGAYLDVTLNSGVEFNAPVVLDCTIQREGVIRTATITFTPVKNGQKGDIGYTGPIQRVFYDALVHGQEYRNDSGSSTAMGVRIQDVVLIECKDATSGYLAFFCINTFTYKNDEGKDLSFKGKDATQIKEDMLQTFDGDVRFAEVGINYSSAFFTQLIARNANVRMFSGAEIVMLDADNNVVAGVSNAGVKSTGEGGEQIGYHFWSGDANPNEASFSVNENGILYSKGGTFDGFLQTSFKKDDSDDDVQLKVSNPNIACQRDKTYTLPSPSDDISGIHFVLIDNVAGGFMNTGDNFVSVNINGEGRFFGSEVFVNGTSYEWPKRIMFRSGIIDFICYNKKWWVYNKNVEYLETDITSKIRKKERIGKQEVVYFSSLSAALKEFPEYTYKNEKFSVNITGTSSYDFTISAAIQETKDNQTGLYELSVTPTTELDSQKNASVHTTVYKFGDEGNSESCVWRVTQSDVGGASKALPLIVKITYTPFSI